MKDGRIEHDERAASRRPPPDRSTGWPPSSCSTASSSGRCCATASARSLAILTVALGVGLVLAIELAGEAAAGSFRSSIETPERARGLRGDRGGRRSRRRRRPARAPAVPDPGDAPDRGRGHGARSSRRTFTLRRRRSAGDCDRRQTLPIDAARLAPWPTMRCRRHGWRIARRTTPSSCRPASAGSPATRFNSWSTTGSPPFVVGGVMPARCARRPPRHGHRDGGPRARPPGARGPDSRALPRTTAAGTRCILRRRAAACRSTLGAPAARGAAGRRGPAAPRRGDGGEPPHARRLPLEPPRPVLRRAHRRRPS